MYPTLNISKTSLWVGVEVKTSKVIMYLGAVQPHTPSAQTAIHYKEGKTELYKAALTQAFNTSKPINVL